MRTIPNFKIYSEDKISQEFLKRGILTFKDASEFIQNLRYGRNANKDNLTTLFIDNCGTCSTKHAALKQLALENGIDYIKLMLGIFKMNGLNTPKIKETLLKNNLSYIPEAHTYLKYDSNYFDFTRKNSSPNNFLGYLLYEVEIKSDEINLGKIKLHQAFLKDWLNGNSLIKHSFDDIWRIREQCIMDLMD